MFAIFIKNLLNIAVFIFRILPLNPKLCFSEEFARPSFFAKNKTEETNVDESEMAGFRRKGFKESRGAGGKGPVGNWELHTKGVASKLMMKVRISYSACLSIR